jgi:ankyrin repeat protein
MRAKLIKESLDDILKPKSEEEILKNIINNNLNANDLLIASINAKNLEGVKQAILNKANINLIVFLNQTPLDIAFRKKDKSIINYLLNNGAITYNEFITYKY